MLRAAQGNLLEAIAPADQGQFKRIPHTVHLRDWWSERDYFLEHLQFLSPYAILLLLAENPANANVCIDWQFGPLCFNGWADFSDFRPNARREETFLIATEGRSDVRILKHAFSLLHPEIEDFFAFIDMGEGYPFAGAGNLVRFAQGLVKLDIQNNIVFLFDNDAEGIDAFRRTKSLDLPINMRAARLPDLNDLDAISAIGPDGVTPSNINGRAASIECYLDFEVPGVPRPEIRWTNYKEQIDAYQGVLCNKHDYEAAFLKENTRLLSPDYDASKLGKVLGHIIGICANIAADLLGGPGWASYND